MKICLITILKSTPKDINAFINYYHSLGVEEIIFIDDNNNIGNPLQSIVGYPFKIPQRFYEAQSTLLSIYRNKYDYIIFLEQDDYIATKDNKRLDELLNDSMYIISKRNRDNGIRSIVKCDQNNNFVLYNIINDAKIDSTKLWLK